MCELRCFCYAVTQDSLGSCAGLLVCALEFSSPGRRGAVTSPLLRGLCFHLSSVWASGHRYFYINVAVGDCIIKL